MEYFQVVQSIIEGVKSIILDKEKQIKLAVACFLARGHLLIEDVPGTGKTTLVKAISKLLGLEFKRIQCTNDLLPGDILGSYVFNPKKREFFFHPGPIFSNIVLVDEINRATPKTQSGLLEAMAEGQVTIEGTTHVLPRPFFIVATQNSEEQAGTYPLPDSQIDRFMFKIKLGYPSKEAEKLLLKQGDRDVMLNYIKPKITREQVFQLQIKVDEVVTSEAIIDYIGEVVEYTRNSTLFMSGLSTRASFMLLRSVKAWALIHGRNFVLPEDVKEMVYWVGNHRLKPKDYETNSQEIIEKLLKTIPIP
ncbi:AAA family ATPase [Desulfothermus okinawensis JCM 13304]